MPASPSGVVLTVLAVVVAGGDPAAETISIDKGLLDGLRPGDRGAIHYVLTVGAEERRIPAGEAVVESVTRHESAIEVDAERPVHPGYRVTFELPPDRLAPAELLAAVREYLPEAERRQVAREVVEEWILRRDEATRELLREHLKPEVSSRPSGASEGTSAPRESPEAAPPRSPDSDRAAASARGDDEEQLSARDDRGAEPTAQEDDAASVADGAVSPEESATPRGRSAGLPPDSRLPPATVPPGMLLVPAGTYSIGLSPRQAGYYNQQPRFDTFLEAFWIDVEPVRLGAVGEGQLIEGAAADHPPGDGRDHSTPSAKLPPLEMTGETARYLTNLTFPEAAAFCHRLGKRLPTELEWEAALTTDEKTASTPAEDDPHLENPVLETPVLETPILETPILEWTASWYRPYPGNPVSEAEYGERYRVLRGAREGEILSPHRRRFMAPDARHPRVGFRCVLDQ